MTQQTAGEWLKANGHSVKRRSVSTRAYRSRDLAERMRDVRARAETVKEFVEGQRNAKSAECIFVPNSIKGNPARVDHFGRTISAARYMALLTHGTPRNDGAVARHLCGNGHLSCINPAHIEWGFEVDNIADANKHRGCETAQDKIHATAGRK